MATVYFIYGSCSSARASCSGSRRAAGRVLSRRSLAYLAAFALTHGSFEWAKMVELLSPR